MTDPSHENVNIAESLVLVERVRDGDQSAAEELFHRHVGRLIALAHSRLSARLGRRIDPEDVVQSAFCSFFRHAQAGKFSIEKGGDLWRLLVVITLNKLREKVEYHSAGKRRYSQEQSGKHNDNLQSFHYEVAAREPTPDAAAEVLEEIEQLTSGMDEVQRRMVELRLQGYQLEEIAAEVGRSERTVRRVMDKVKARLEERMGEVE